MQGRRTRATAVMPFPQRACTLCASADSGAPLQDTMHDVFDRPAVRTALGGMDLLPDGMLQAASIHDLLGGPHLVGVGHVMNVVAVRARAQ